MIRCAQDLGGKEVQPNDVDADTPMCPTCANTFFEVFLGGGRVPGFQKCFLEPSMFYA